MIRVCIVQCVYEGIAGREIQLQLGTSGVDIDNLGGRAFPNTEKVLRKGLKEVVGFGESIEDASGDDLTIWAWTADTNVVRG